jgi:ABC-type polysaccharide/polyol phosphate transport system ATPase subunit
LHLPRDEAADDMKVISVENVSKKFILAHDRPRSLADAARGVFRRKRREDFWALKDVSFEVEQGEALGIIGDNGAGKSTMLKLLSRIMEPTKGRIRTRGRVSALIEIGAGFHPEMSGRENVYLNGSILGMSHREIDAKFDAIVSFAELERFIDTPVKRYSSGMYVRLGFSVAAHIEPEILIVDEVLSVGDARFQAKSLDHMRRLMSEGTTVLFVSHNVGAVEATCNRAIILEKGAVAFEGEAKATVSAYRRKCLAESAIEGVTGAPTRHGNGLIRITRFEMLDIQGNRVTKAKCGEEITLRLYFDAKEVVRQPDFGFTFYTPDGEILSNPLTRDYRQSPAEVFGKGYLDYRIDCLMLNPGVYPLSMHVWDAAGLHSMDHVEKACQFEVVPDDSSGRPHERVGIVSLGGTWSVARVVD